LSYRPARRGDEFVFTWVQRPEIRFVAPSGLVDHREELEVNLIHAPGEMDCEGMAVVSRHDPGHEARRQTLREKVRRTAVEPVLGQVEVTRHAIPRRPQRFRQRLRWVKFTILDDREQVHIPSSPHDEAESSQGGTSDDDYLLLGVKRPQLFRESGKDQVECLPTDLHVSQSNRGGCSTSRIGMLNDLIHDVGHP